MRLTRWVDKNEKERKKKLRLKVKIKIERATFKRRELRIAGSLLLSEIVRDAFSPDHKG